MEKEFVAYELAVKLKELGFDEPCIGYYHVNEGYTKGYAFCYFNVPKRFEDGSQHFINDLVAPTFSQAFRWFREKHNMQSAIKFTHSKYSFDIHFERLANGENPPVMVWHLVDSWLGLNLDLFETYEEAELTCLTMLIEIVESKSE